jgi:gamma-glutamylcyclotransferase (GGCT)/AIG2-like uncharacterized protein YtfP
MKKRLYIAYGSNLNTSQMRWRCPDSRPVAKSWLHDYRLVFQGNPYGAHANVIPEKGQEVPVVIWEITPQDERALDRYEGVAGGYYTKETMEVEVAGEMREALIYIMTPHGYGIPADGYLDTIAEGYDNYNLGIRYLNEAVEHAYKHTRRLRYGMRGAAAPATL